MASRNFTAPRDAILDQFYILDQQLIELDRALQKFGERELGDAVKRARRELELIRRLGVYEDREV